MAHFGKDIFSMNKVLVTGANGFVGKNLCRQLLAENYTVNAAVREVCDFSNQVEIYPVGNIDEHTNWEVALIGCDTVFHLAARVHVLKDNSNNPLMEFRRVNTIATEHLARSAVAKGIKRFVYVSSIKVNGEEANRPYSELDTPNPRDAYGISKLEAEKVLKKIAKETGLEVVIVRPPLVYGEGVKGNFGQMMIVLKKGIPLPFSSIKNLRSLIYVENLVSALMLCAIHPNASGQTYLVSDGHDLSTPDLLCCIGNAIKRPARLFACALVILKFLGKLTGKSNEINRLLGSLQVDSRKIRNELGWIPPFTFYDGISRTVQGYTKND
jgi:nucleoside-diphosphate-sugar epimerase